MKIDRFFPKAFFSKLLFCIGLLLATGRADAAWNLVWSDEFSGSSINSSNWTYDTGTGSGGWGNNELQYYTSRSQNVRVENGSLVIQALKESYGGMGYTSARLKTLGLRSWTYGRLEARMLLPYGQTQGIWPAFWMLGTNFPSAGWPSCGEIDVMERVNQESVTHGTIHWNSNGYQFYGAASFSVDMSQYHVYAIEWNSSSIKWFVDGTQYLEANIQNSINGTDEFHRPFFLLLNLAVGGNWPGYPNSSTYFPATMYVDYVRVYQDGGSGGGGGTPVAAGTYSLRNRASGKMLDNLGSTADGANVCQWAAGSSDNQKYVLSYTSDGYAKLMCITGSKYVDSLNRTGNGSIVGQWAGGSSYNQQWTLQDAGGGYYKIVNRANGLCLDTGGGTTDGSAMQFWTSGSSYNQQWQFVTPGSGGGGGGGGTSATWYLFNSSVSGVSPSGQGLQTAKSGITGWQPTKSITTTASYWYGPATSVTIAAGTWNVYLWSNNPGATSNIRVEVYRVSSNGGSATLIGAQTRDISTTGSGNHETAFTFTGSATSLSSQRLMVKVYKASGADATIAYNTNDFASRLVTP